MGKIKAIRAFVTWSRDEDYYSDDWHGTLEKECGGVLINQAIHTVDLVQYFGGKCKSLTAHVANDHLKGKIEVEDNASVLMKLENGVTAMLYATTAYAENSDVFIEILTEKGKLRLEGEKLYAFDEKEILQKSNAAPRSFITAKAIGAADIQHLSTISTIASQTAKNLKSMLLKAVTPQKSLPPAINRPQRAKA